MMTLMMMTSIKSKMKTSHRLIYWATMNYVQVSFKDVNGSFHLLFITGDTTVKSLTFDEFCNALKDISGDHCFSAPFMGSFPGYQAIIAAPTSEDPGELTTHSDIDSAHLICEDIPVVGPLALYALMDYKFTIQHPNHFTVQVPSISKPVELCNIPNFRMAEFGFGNRWQVIHRCICSSVIDSNCLFCPVKGEHLFPDNAP